MVFCIALCCLPAAAIGQSEPAHSYTPDNGFVPDSLTAVRIAVAVWAPIYGEAAIRKEEPFHASLKNDIWTVTGFLPAPPPGMESVGGVALAEIAKKDGRIIRVSHGK